MSSEVLMTPVDVSARGFNDGSSHRAQLPAIYQEYLAVTPANGFDGKTDDLQCILRILFVTSMHMDDHRDRDGLAAHDARIAEASQAFCHIAASWIDLRTHAFADMNATYAALLSGVAPKDGHIVTLQ